MASRSLFGSVLPSSILLGALMVSQSASALSCARPDVIRTLEEAKASPKNYHVLVGRFISRGTRHRSNPGGYVSPEDPFKSRKPEITRSYFEGVSLAKNRRNDYPLSRFPVDIETSCVASWCSSLPNSKQELIAFVEARDGQPPILRIAPCSGQTFQAEAKAVRKVRQCLDKTCQSDGRGW